MLKYILCALFSVALQVETCTAQSGDHTLEVTNWGAPACGAQLSIAETNHIVLRESTTTLFTHIKNTTTNFIYLVMVAPTIDYSVFISNGAGKVTWLNKGVRDTDSRHFADKLNPGEIYTCSVPLKAGNEIKPGSYRMYAVREVLVPDVKNENNNKLCKFTSNLLDIEIK